MVLLMNSCAGGDKDYDTNPEELVPAVQTELGHKVYAAQAGSVDRSSLSTPESGLASRWRDSRCCAAFGDDDGGRTRECVGGALLSGASESRS